MLGFRGWVQEGEEGVFEGGGEDLEIAEGFVAGEQLAKELFDLVGLEGGEAGVLVGGGGEDAGQGAELGERDGRAAADDARVAGALDLGGCALAEDAALVDDDDAVARASASSR